MGACLGSFAASCATNLCCRACCSSKGGDAEDKKAASAPGSRVPYVILFFVLTCLAVFLRYWHGLSVNLLIASFRLCGTERCTGYAAVFRITCAGVFFFLAMAAASFGSRRARAVDRDYWIAKVLLLAAVTIGAWFLPNGFYEGYSHLARGVGGVFLLLQIVILLDAVHTLQETWMAREWKAAILGASFACLAASLVVLVFLFRWFGGAGCSLEKGLLAVTIILTVVFLALSVSPLSRHGVLPAAALCAYCYYLAYSALSSDPSPCNTLRSGDGRTVQVIVGLVITALSVTYASYSLASAPAIAGDGDGEGVGGAEGGRESRSSASDFAYGSPADVEVGGVGRSKGGKGDGQQSSFLEDGGSSGGGGSNSEAAADGAGDEGDGEGVGATGAAGEGRRLGRFHLVMAAACMYTAMLLTSWGSVHTAAAASSEVDRASMWVKVVTQWLTALLYIWTFFAPKCFPDRDFD